MLVLALAGFHAAAASAAGPVRIPLDAMGNSGESGVAILTAAGSKAIVVEDVVQDGGRTTNTLNASLGFGISNTRLGSGAY